MAENTDTIYYSLLCIACSYVLSQGDVYHIIYNTTHSQKVSTEWRLNSAKSSIKHAYEHPFIRHGCGSYTMISENGDIDSFSSFAPNLHVMLFVENKRPHYLSELLSVRKVDHHRFDRPLCYFASGGMSLKDYSREDY